MAENELPLFADNYSNTGDLALNIGDLSLNTGELPNALQQRLDELTPKARKEKVWPVIVWLCALRAYTTEQLAALLNRQAAALRSAHLNPLREQEKLIDYTYPEVINHPEQASQVTSKGVSWLKQQGICDDD